MGKAIGILGGTFNPIHNAHLAMAESALKQAELDEIWFMPSKNPPHKSNGEIVAQEHRSKMIQLAIGSNPYFIFSDYELQRDGITYTAETLKKLKKDYPQYIFHFIMGGDSFFHLEEWYHPEEILSNCKILAISRDGATTEQMQHHKEYLNEKYQGNIQIIKMETMDISSTKIRQEIQKGNDTSYVPKKVLEYIQNHQLYQHPIS